MFLTYKSVRLSLYFFLAIFCLMATACKQTKDPADGAMRVSAPKNNVTPQLADACEIATANKYYLPRRLIHAYHAVQAQDGSIIVKLKADSREAQCSVNAAGTIHSVVDTSPKSEDQIAAERVAAATQTHNPPKK